MVRILTWALIFKLGASLLRFHVAFGLYGGVADATGYHDWGIDIAANIRSLDLQTGLPDLPGHQLHPIPDRHRVLDRSSEEQLGGFLIFSWLGFLGLFLLYRAFVIAVPEGRSRTYARFVFFFPSMLFWPSSIGKEAWKIHEHQE